MGEPRVRFYSARFLLGWAAHEAQDLADVEVAGVRPREVEGLYRPMAGSAVSNLRLSLEYLAHELAREACPKSRPERVSFPIAQDAHAFRSMMTTRFPGLRTNHPQLWGILLREQAFTTPPDDWLPVLHGLWNRTIPIRWGLPGDPSITPTGRAVASGQVPVAEGPPRFSFLRGRGLTEFLIAAADRERQLIARIDECLGRIAAS